MNVRSTFGIGIVLSGLWLSACIEQSSVGAVCFEDADCSNSVCIFVPGELEGLCLEEDEGCVGNAEVTRDQAIVDQSGIAGLIPTQGNVCVKLVGDLVIEAADLTSLDGLERLLEVTGDIRIRDNDTLENILGLSHLQRVGGDILVASNPALSAVEFSRLYAVQDLEVSGSNALQDLDGLESLTLVEGSLKVAGNPNLRSMAGLSSLLSIGANLEIHDNATLEELGFERLSSVDGQIAIYLNPNLPQCEALALADELGNSAATINTNDESASCVDVSVIAE